MNQDWITSDAGQAVLGLVQDARPAWLWTSAEEPAIWHNRAAELLQFGKTRDRKTGYDNISAASARPIKGQIKRLLRLGFTGVPSLARIQMLVAGRPVSLTCHYTPLKLADGSIALLCVGADTTEQGEPETETPVPIRTEGLLSHLGAYLFMDDQRRALFGSAAGLDALDDGALPYDSNTRKTDVGQGMTLVEFDRNASAASASDENSDADESDLDTVPDILAEVETESVTPAEGRLAGLMNQFSASSNLYAPLGPEDEELPDAFKQPEPELSHGTGEIAGATTEDDDGFGALDAAVDPQDLADLKALDGIEDDDIAAQPDKASEVEDIYEADEETTSAPGSQVFRVTGRGFVPDEAPNTSTEIPSHVEEIKDAFEQQAVTSVEEKGGDQSARYNFDELARVLTERVNHESGLRSTSAVSSPSPAASAHQGEGSRTLSLSDEHLVLNRLPLGILVFRDQEIVFANRAMADLLACESIAQLRERGLDAIFPRMDSPDVHPGPVAKLLDAQGTQVPVSARLQAITWHGGPALMLSARREDNSLPGETAVRAFVQTLAGTRGDGFVEISRSGVIERLSGRASEILGNAEDQIVGRPLALFVSPQHIPAFRIFLEKPAKSAGIERPSIDVDTRNDARLALFTEGHAGIVSGYFGLISAAHRVHGKTETHSDDEQIDPAMMARLSRGLRRPLNTIIGFAQLMESEAFGALGNPRYLEYARDIEASGREIEGLVDELDQYDRLQRGQYETHSSTFALDALLDECEIVVRQQATRRQVFVRSAISERLPEINADRNTMRQAILNLLASAIDQTPQGGKVILSAQAEDDGGVGVHVRDSSSGTGELAERFSVFREAKGQKVEAMVALKSSIGLALTRSLLAVNACTLAIYPSSGTGTLMSLVIPPDLVQRAEMRAD